MVRSLLFLDDRSPDSEGIVSAWDQKITDRMGATDNGTAVGIDYHQAMQTIEKRFTC